MSFIISVPLDAGLNYMHIHCSFITEYEMKLSFVCNDLLFILQSVHLLYKYAMRIIVCFIRTRRINLSAYE
jgi:hypothetical protein